MSEVNPDDRKTYLGSSDAASIMGVGFKSPVQVYLEKVVDIETEQPEGEAIEWGNILEPVILRKFESQNNGHAHDFQRFDVNRQHNFIGSHVDAMFLRYDTAFAFCPTEILEVKNVGYHRLKEWGEDLDDIPLKYHWQCAHHMLAHNKKVCNVAVLIGGQNYREYRIERSQAIEDRLVERLVAFWQCIQNRTPPTPTTTDDCRRLFRRSVVDAKEIEDVELLDSWRSLEIIRKTIAQLEQQKDQHETRLMNAMAECESLLFDGQPIATWKGTTTKRIDIDKLRREFPQIAEQCTVESTSRRFLVKEIKVKELTNG